MNASCDLNEQDDLVGQAVEEYFKLLSTGERPEMETFLARFPDIRDILKSVIPALQLADSSIGEPTFTGLHEHRQIGDFRILRQIGCGGTFGTQRPPKRNGLVPNRRVRFLYAFLRTVNG